MTHVNASVAVEIINNYCIAHLRKNYVKMDNDQTYN